MKIAILLLALIVFCPTPKATAACATCMGQCSRELPCAGDCGCVIRPGQPWGRCAAY